MENRMFIKFILSFFIILSHLCERYGKERRMEGKKVVERPRTKVLDWMIQETDGETYEDLKKLAMYRKQWRTWHLGPV